MDSFARCERNVLPRHVVDHARQVPKSAFVDAFEGQPLLLVRVPSAICELAVGLTEVGTAASDRLMPTLGFETEIATHPSKMLDLKRLAPPPPRPLHTPAKIQAILARGLHFVVPLTRRAGPERPFEERVTVGRTRNSDIVLRDPSVSKFHAWFQCDERERYFLFDSTSRNGTFVEGNRVLPQSPLEVPPGAQMLFASIAVTLTTPEVLWEAFEAYRPVRPLQSWPPSRGK